MLPALLLAALPGAPPAALDVKLPPGFTARLYADNPLAPDAYTMTIDAEGRVLVAGKGYVRALEDTDGDGVADRAVDIITDLKQGPMGLLAEGDSLFVVCDGGLKRYKGYTGKDKLKGPPETLLALKTGGEHDAHAVRRGSDGWLYVLCGNMAGVKKDTIRGDRSPVKDRIAGALIRLSPDFKQVEVVADGFRNPYSFDFDRNGEPFTFDSDNERCVGLPWYEGCRFYHVVPGGNYGWRSPQLSQTWRKPPYFPDVVPPVCDTGRGSPTGVACYRHTAFPERFLGGFFIADWTFGKVHFVPLTPKGASYAGKPEVFLEPTGTSGFAPTAVEVHPKTGELFVSIGGRGTRGGVYRVAADKPTAGAKPIPMAKRTLDFFENNNWLESAKTGDARVRREALELIARWWDKLPSKEIVATLRANLAHEDKLVRRAAGSVTARWFGDLGKLESLQSRITVALANASKDQRAALDVGLEALSAKGANETEKLEGVRLLQLAYGDLTAPKSVGTAFEGYTLREPPSEKGAEALVRGLSLHLKKRYEAEDMQKPLSEFDRELMRLLAAVGVPKDADAYPVTQWFSVNLTRAYFMKDARVDVHWLACVARLPHDRARDLEPGATELLRNLESKRAKQQLGADRFWPVRLDEIVTALVRENPTVARDLFARGSVDAGHIWLIKHLDEKRENVGRAFLPVATNHADAPRVAELFPYLGALPRDEWANALGVLWDRPQHRDALVRVIAKSAIPADVPRFTEALSSLDAGTVRASAGALVKLNAPGSANLYASAIRAMRRFSDAKADAGVRGDLVTLLQKASGEKIGADERAWSAWAAKTHPEAAKALATADGFDAAAWAKRVSAIDITKGDAERGRAAFTKATCAACHDGGGAVGPSLAGIGKRFGRDDLLTSIVQPSKDVPARYRPTRVSTTDERTFTGVVIYEAADGVILQTGADTTVRIGGADIVSKKQVDVSLMPAGLLDKLSDAEIADLMAYLGKL
jgi:putative heme-binding domain-containing protein